MSTEIYDLAIIGGGIHGCAIALEAATRGMQVLLLEKDGLGSGTSSKSSKLIHGGLRYLEYGEFRLVRESLKERETLLARTPELVQELRFVIPHEKHHRPWWLMRLGLFLYDHLAPRKNLGASQTVRLDQAPYAGILKPHLRTGFVYSDCLTDDLALVKWNADAARARGTTILTKTPLIHAEQNQALWQLTTPEGKFQAHQLVNATGPWAADFYEKMLHEPCPYQMELVQGSHIILPQFYEGNFAFLLQTPSKRVIFVLPWKGQTLVGTTEVAYQGDPCLAKISEAEIADLLTIVNSYFQKQFQASDIIGSFSGVRPLLREKGCSLSAVSRDYVLKFDRPQQLLNVLSGKLTIHRKLAQEAVDLLQSGRILR